MALLKTFYGDCQVFRDFTYLLTVLVSNTCKSQGSTLAYCSGLPACTQSVMPPFMCWSSEKNKE